MLALGKSAVFASMILGSCLNPLAAQRPRTLHLWKPDRTGGRTPLLQTDLAVQTARPASEGGVRDARQASRGQEPPPRQVGSATNHTRKRSLEKEGSGNFYNAGARPWNDLPVPWLIDAEFRRGSTVCGRN